MYESGSPVLEVATGTGYYIDEDMKKPLNDWDGDCATGAGANTIKDLKDEIQAT